MRILLGTLFLAAPLAAYESGLPVRHTGGFGEPSCIAYHQEGPNTGKPASVRLELGAYVPGAKQQIRVVIRSVFANRWGFPKPEVTARWRRGGAAVEVTADAGAVSIDLTRDGVALEREREVRHRYWQAASPPGL